MSKNKTAPNLKRRMQEANDEERATLIAQLPYEIGFGKPPKQTRFKPGQSGNSKGRRRGSFNMMTIVQKELEQEVEVSEGGRRCRMPKVQIGIRQLANKAASGDPKAIAMFIDLMRKMGKLNEAPAPAAPAVDERDLQAIGGLLALFQAAHSSDSKESK
jgi:hypothetical protein